MSKKDNLPSIDPDDLDQVTGGASRKPTATTGDDAQMTSLLQGITDSLKELSASKNDKGSSMRDLLPFLLLMQGDYGGRGGGGGFGGGGGCGPGGCGPGGCKR